MGDNRGHVSSELNHQYMPSKNTYKPMNNKALCTLIDKFVSTLFTPYVQNKWKPKR